MSQKCHKSFTQVSQKFHTSVTEVSHKRHKSDSVALNHFNAPMLQCLIFTHCNALDQTHKLRHFTDVSKVDIAHTQMLTIVCLYFCTVASELGLFAFQYIGPSSLSGCSWWVPPLPMLFFTLLLYFSKINLNEVSLSKKVFFLSGCSGKFGGPKGQARHIVGKVNI